MKATNKHRRMPESPAIPSSTGDFLVMDGVLRSAVYPLFGGLMRTRLRVT